MVCSKRLVYPAFIKRDEEGVFGVYFPTLFPESGWEFPLSRGKTEHKAILNAKKDLAYSLAGILYDNEDLPEAVPIPINCLSEGMDLIDIETSFEPYAEEIRDHLKGRHWHIGYYVEGNEDYIEAIGFKNDQGNWDIYFNNYNEELNIGICKETPEFPDHVLLFTVKTHSEAEEKFHQFVEEVILKRRES